jgi:FkbM family methyltransferase
MDNKLVDHLKTQFKTKKAWYGSSYGGFYINPEVLDHSAVVLSFGIGKDISFDMACIERHGCKVYGFDPTPKSIEWVSSNVSNEKFIFLPFGIGAKSGSSNFHLPKNKKAVSGSIHYADFLDKEEVISVELKSFDDLVAHLHLERVDVVKMDIEGAEYEVLQSIVDSKIEVQQILVEFHDRIFSEREPKSKHIVSYLNENGYKIFAHSLNYEEISFFKAIKS